MSMVDEIKRDADKLRSLEKAADELRKSLRVRVRAELDAGKTIPEMAERTEWSRETIRKIRVAGGPTQASTSWAALVAYEAGKNPADIARNLGIPKAQVTEIIREAGK